jgi:hypothetical protein
MSEVLIFPSKGDDRDKEITVIANLVAILGQCEPAQSIRILRYLHSLYSTPPYTTRATSLSAARLGHEILRSRDLQGRLPKA